MTIHRCTARSVGGLLGALLAASACSSGSSSSSGLVERDSAGIRITLAKGPASPDSVAWTPTLTIGREDSGPAYQFDQVAGLVLRADGSVVVANGGTGEIRFFGPDGVLVRSVGRAGPGPGEFSRIAKLLPYRRDSLLVWDFTRRQATILDRDGGFGRILAVTTAEPNPTIVGAYPDGSLLVGSRHLRLAPGENADSVVFQRLSPDGLPHGVMGWFRTSMVHLLVTATGPVVDEHPFQPRADVAVAENGFIVALGGRAALQVIDPAGRLVAEQRWGLEPAPLDPAEVAAWKLESLSGQRSDAARSQRQAWLDDLTLPDRAPVVAGVRLADDGTRWVQRFQLGHAAVRFDLLAQDGRWLGSAEFPSGFALMAVSGGRAAGILRDADGVERIALFHRPTP